MDQELKEEIVALRRVVEENHKILKKMQKSVKISQFFSVIRWMILIAIIVGGVYYLQPVFEKMNDVYRSVTGVNLPGIETILKGI